MSSNIDWSDSDTGLLESWKNPMCSAEENLIAADGAIHFRDNVIKNLRKQIEDLKTSLKEAQYTIDAYEYERMEDGWYE